MDPVDAPAESLDPNRLATLDRNLWRMLDANLNRCMEGLRTLEDVARFLLDDALSSEQMKSLRHSLASVAARWPRQELLGGRDVSHDVGVTIKEAAELQRDSMASVVAAAASRAQQALRVLEEIAKRFDVTGAVTLEALRYRLYTVAAHVELRLSRTGRLQAARLYVLIDCGTSEAALVEHVMQLASAGADVIQLRDKQCADRLLFDRAVAAARALKTTTTLLIINDRADVAVAADADGVHVGQHELPAAAARRVVGSQRLVGVSTRQVEHIHAAVASGADYIGCGPTFPSQTKQFDQFAGLEYLKQVAALQTIPAFAIGGIDLQQVTQVMQTGIRRIAVSAAVSGSDQPYEKVRQLRQALEVRSLGQPEYATTT